MDSGSEGAGPSEDCGDSPRPSLEAFRALVLDPTMQVVVSDLDGVLRRFDEHLWERLDAHLGRPTDTAYRAILRSPLLGEVVRGRATHAQWRQRILEDLEADGIDPDTAHEALRTWLDSAPALDRGVLGVLEDARRAGREVFVFTNGTDRVREELRGFGLDRMLRPDGSGDRLLNSAELGAAKPDAEAYDAAHARIQQVLGRSIPRSAVAFLDDSARHVSGAREAGWRAILLRD